MREKIPDMPKQSSVGSTLRRFGFKQSLKGALIIGILAGIMIGGQGYAYTATYPDETSRVQFKSSLEKAPALGIIYGETGNLPSPAGYMVYRTVMFLTVVTSIWGLITVIKLLRGQEEDGRWETIAAGSVTSKNASCQIFFGFGLAFLLAFALTAGATTLYGMIPAIGAPPATGLLISLVMFVPAALFAGLGFLVSQLAVTKRRALFYGLIPLLIFFAIRIIGNTSTDLRWLKMFTPFGWAELANPVVDSQIAWLLPAILLFLVFFFVGAYFIGKRDMGAGIIPEPNTVKSHFILLGSSMQFALRRNSILFAAWGLGALALSALMAVISGIAADAIADSPSLKGAVSQLGGSQNLTVAFIGAGLVLNAIILLLAATAGLSNIRSGEARNQLDNILVQPIRRSAWLIGRFAIIVLAALVISLTCALAIWAMAHAQNISLDLGNLLLVSIALLGTVILTLGFGTLLYGLLPRLAATGMYIVIAWSFLIDMVGSVVKLDDIIAKSSLLHYISISPTDTPNWVTFAWLVGLGLAMATAGIFAFTRRDIVAE
jgi:polyether ionophore transport system permease protein